MKAQVEALRELLNAVDLNNRIESLKLYATALAIAGVLEKQIEPSRFPKAKHALEKLGLFTDYFQRAVIPSQGTAPDPRGWLEAAGDMLTMVERDVSSV